MIFPDDTSNTSQLIRLHSTELPYDQFAGSKKRLHCPTVGVLVSTYNGEQYLIQQLDSIATQVNVQIVLFVRDDGSFDSTRSIISHYLTQHADLFADFKFIPADNVGYVASFLELISIANGCDYYAFSDQDDYWKPDKLNIAISSISKYVSRKPALYASSVETTNERLEPIATNNFPGFIYSISSELVRHRLAGHTMVWNAELHRILKRMVDLPCWSHDQLVVISNLLCRGDLLLDSSSHVKHRRLESSLTPGGTGFIKRIRHELKLTVNKEKSMDRTALALAIKKKKAISLTESDSAFLDYCICGNRGIEQRVKFVRSRLVDCGLLTGNIEAMISILLGRF